MSSRAKHSHELALRRGVYQHDSQRAQGLVRGVTPQSLRDNDSLRQHVAGEMSQVQARLEGLIVERPRRRIIRPTSSHNGNGHAAAH